MLHPPRCRRQSRHFIHFMSGKVGAQICKSLIEQVYFILASGEDAWGKNPNIFSHMVVNRKQSPEKQIQELGDHWIISIMVQVS